MVLVGGGGVDVGVVDVVLVLLLDKYQYHSLTTAPYSRGKSWHIEYGEQNRILSTVGGCGNLQNPKPSSIGGGG